MENEKNPMSGEEDKTILSRIVYTPLLLVFPYLVCQIAKWRVIFEVLKKIFSRENHLTERLKQTKLELKMFHTEIAKLKEEKDAEKHEHHDQLETIRNYLLNLIDRCKEQNESIDLPSNNGKMQLCHDESDVNSMDLKSCLQHINELDKIVFAQQRRARESTEQAQQRMDEALEEYKNLKRNIIDIRVINEKLNADLSKSEKLLNNTRQQLTEKDHILSENLLQISSFKNKLENLERKLSEESGKIQQLHSIIVGKEEEICEKNRTLSDKSAEIEALNMKSRDAFGMIEQLRSSIDDKEKELAEKEQLSTENLKKTYDLEKNNIDLTTQLESQEHSYKGMEKIIVTIRNIIDRNYSPTGMNDQLDSIELLTDQNQFESSNSAEERTKNLKELLEKCVSFGNKNFEMLKNISVDMNGLKSFVNGKRKRNNDTHIVDMQYRKDHRHTLHDNARRIFGMTMINIEVQSIPVDNECEENLVTPGTSEDT